MMKKKDNSFLPVTVAQIIKLRKRKSVTLSPDWLTVLKTAIETIFATIGKTGPFRQTIKILFGYVGKLNLHIGSPILSVITV